MTVCLGGNACEIATGMVTLQDGETVCNACPVYREVCEAERLLTYSLPERRDALKARVEKRGAEAVERLKRVMADIHARRK